MGALVDFGLKKLHLKTNEIYTFYCLFVIEKSYNSANFGKFH